MLKQEAMRLRLKSY